MFLGSQDIQLGVNESLLDTSIVVSSMVDGIMARVGGHHEIEVRVKKTVSQSVSQCSNFYYIILYVHIAPCKGIFCTSHQCIISKVSSYSNFSRFNDDS